MASVSSVNGKKISKLKFNDTIYDMGGSKNEPITITQNGTYTAPDGVGYSPVSVSVPQTAESGTVKNLLDATKSTYHLFYQYSGTSVDGLISYNDTSNVTKMSSMFSECSNLTTIPLFDTSSCSTMFGMFNKCSNITTIPQFNTSNVTNMSEMFMGCSKLTTIPQLNTSNVTNISHMFNSCKELTTIPQLDTRKVTNMTTMFIGCSKLTTIPQFNTINVTEMSYMFKYCSKLTTIDLTHMKLDSTSKTDNFAYNCYSLTKLIIRNMDTIPALNSNAFTGCYHFTGTTNATYNPNGLKDGRIYVPDDKVEALKTATNWSVYADIIVPLSTLVE